MKSKRPFRLFFYFFSIVLAVMAVTLFLVSSLLLFLSNNKLLPQEYKFTGVPLIILIIVSVIIGLTMSVFVWHKVLSPVTGLSEALKKVARGDFSVRLPESGNISEVMEMSSGFNSMVSELSSIETLRNDFVVSVSHEFKTPLAAIEGYATLLQNNMLSEQKRGEYIGKIIDNTSRLSNMTGNILSLSKLENQELVTDKHQYRLDEQIRKTVLMLENMWSAKNLRFDIELQKKIFYGNEGLIFQVWYNLLSNAIKYSSPGGKIEIRLIEKIDAIEVSISDEGCGMSPDVQKHIFEKFYQGDAARKTEGNGLGLALVKRITELCKGSIHVTSEEGKGSCFEVLLPKE